MAAVVTGSALGLRLLGRARFDRLETDCIAGNGFGIRQLITHTRNTGDVASVTVRLSDQDWHTMWGRKRGHTASSGSWWAAAWVRSERIDPLGEEMV